MAHWAKVTDGIVVDMLVADEAFIATYDDGRPGQWIQTSYNTRGNRHYDPVTMEDDSHLNPPLRGNYASVGFTYDEANDVFYPPRPWPSWHISAATDWIWTPPTPMPLDGESYEWDEQAGTWVLRSRS